MSKNLASRGPLDDLLVFHELARSLTSTLDLKSILRSMLQFMERFIDAELWAVLMVDSKKINCITLPKMEAKIPDWPTCG